MQILKDIGSYAGIGAVVGLAVLSALYFSQARDVKRLREWAGRAPERVAEGTAAQQIAPQRVTAVPQAKPAAPAAQKTAQPAAAQQGAAKPATAAAAAAGAATPQAQQSAATPAAATPAASTAAAQGKQPAAAGAQAKPATDEDKTTEDKEEVAAEAKDSEAAEDKEAAAEAKEPAAVGAAAPGGAAAALGEAKTPQPTASAGTAAPVKPGDGTGDGPPAGTPAAPSQPAKPAAATPAAARPGQTPPPPVPRTPPPKSIPSTPSRAENSPRPGPSQTAILPPYGQEPQPWYRRLLANPRYLVLAIVGVLVVGGAAAFGLTELSKKEAPPPRQAQPPASDTPQKSTKRTKAAPISPHNVTVSVLNGTTVPGLAAQIGDRITAQGFQLGNVTNSSDQQRAESVVLFAPGGQREAAFVGRKLGIAQREPIDQQSQTLAGDARVVVITGADKTR